MWYLHIQADTIMSYFYYLIMAHGNYSFMPHHEVPCLQQNRSDCCTSHPFDPWNMMTFAPPQGGILATNRGDYTRGMVKGGGGGCQTC